MKLKWAKLSGGSEKQFTDALRVYEIQYVNLDLSYMETWVIYIKYRRILGKTKTGSAANNIKSLTRSLQQNQRAGNRISFIFKLRYYQSTVGK
jgi:hypothetical protein